MNVLKYLLGLVAALAVFGPSHIRGTLMTETGNQDRRPGSWRTQIQYLDPDRRMFTQLLLRLSQKKVTDTEFKLFEREHRSRWVRATENIDGSETAITVADGAAFRVDDVVLVPDTGERILVTAVSGNTLTVTRGVLGTSATAQAASITNGWLKILFTRKEENSRAGTPLTTDYQTINNFAQIFEEVYGISRSNKQTKKRGPADLAEERKLALESYKRQLEEAFVWGKKRLEVSGGDTYRYTGGFDEFVTTNRLDAEGGLGFGDISWIVNQTTRYGGTKKIWLVGRDARMQLDTLGLEYMRIKSSENILGMAVDGIRTSFGEFMMVTHHGLENAHADRILVVDPLHIAIAVFMGMKHNMNIQENDRDGEKHQFLGEMGLWLDTEEAHAVITGVSDTI
jgi:hypothetical protein